MTPVANSCQGCSCSSVKLTGDGHVSVCFSFIDDVHDLIRTGHKTLRTALTGSRRVLLQNQQQSCDGHVDSYLHVRNPVLVFVDGEVCL